MMSPKFFCLGNYTAAIDVYPNGEGKAKNTHISIYFKMVEGLFDCFLIWPMMYEEITFKLLIYDEYVHSYAIKSCLSEEAKNWFIRPTKEGKSFGTPKFYPHKNLPMNLRNCTIKICVDVK